MEYRRRSVALVLALALIPSGSGFRAQPSARVLARATRPCIARAVAASRLSIADDDAERERASSVAPAVGALDPRAFVRERVLQGVEPDANLVAILLVYFVQGSLGLASLAVTLYLKDELHLSAAQVAALGGLFSAPWVIKPLYGFVTDTFPLFGSRRRSYLATAGLLATTSYAALAAGLPSAAAAAAAVTCASFAIAVTDVVADAMVVENVRAMAGPAAPADGSEREGAAAGAGTLAERAAAELSYAAADARASAELKLSGTLQSLCWGSRAVGALASSYASGAAVQALGPRAVFALAALLPLMVVGAAAFVDEDAAAPAPAALAAAAANDPSGSGDGGPAAAGAAQLRLLWSTVRQPSIYTPALFIFGWLAMPSADSAFLFFVTDDLKLSPEFLGRVRFVGALSSLAAIAGYQRYLTEVRVSRVLLGCTLASALFGLLQIGLATHANRAFGVADSWLTLGDDALLSALAELAHMPVLVLAARICPAGVEGALFATLMSVYNAGGTVGGELGAALTAALHVGDGGDFSQLPLLLGICSVAKLLPLPFLGVLDAAARMPGADKAGTGAARDADADDRDRLE